MQGCMSKLCEFGGRLEQLIPSQAIYRRLGVRPVKVEGYEMYLVNEEGTVVNSRTGRVLREDLSSAGYKRVTMSAEGKTKRMTVHRIVAETFLIKNNETDVVNHKDGNKLNNCVENLEWVTPSENARHAFRTGLRVAPNSLPAHVVEGVRYLRTTGMTRKEVARHFDIKESRVEDILYRYYK